MNEELENNEQLRHSIASMVYERKALVQKAKLCFRRADELQEKINRLRLSLQ